MTDRDTKPDNILSRLWLSYELQVLPRDAGESQRTETRRAWYAGAFAVMSTMKLIGDRTDTPEDNARCAAVLECVDREIETFYEDVAKGRA